MRKKVEVGVQKLGLKLGENIEKCVTTIHHTVHYQMPQTISGCWNVLTHDTYWIAI